MQKLTASTWFKNPWLIFAVFLVIAVSIYKPAISGGFIWDDQAHVTKPELQSASGLVQIWINPAATQQYYPLLHTAFWIEYKLWANNPLGYHLLNVCLHVIASLLFIRILNYYKVPGAILAGVLFLIHPICVESVAWISEQKNTLSLVIYLTTWLTYLKYLDSKRNTYYWTAFLLFTCALLTKSVTATLPAALLLATWYKEGRLNFNNHIKPLLIWFGIAITSGLFTAWIERHLIGATGTEFNLTFIERCFLCCKIICFYFSKLLLPINLIFFYPHWSVHTHWNTWILYVIVVITITLTLWFLRNKFRGLAVSWLLFCGSLFPALGFFNVYPFRFSYVADHFQYLPSLAIFALLGAGISICLKSIKAYYSLGIIFITVGIICLITLAYNQANDYRDLKTLYSSTLSKNPDAWIAHYNLGIILAHEGDYDQAIDHFSKAVSLKSDYTEALVNWGDAVGQSGKPLEAIDLYRRALAIDPTQIEATTNLGFYLGRIGQTSEAIQQLTYALRLSNTYSPAHYNLANVLRTAGKLDDAIMHYSLAIKYDPNFSNAYLNLGNIYLSQNQFALAIDQYSHALKIKPEASEIHNSLGVALVQVGNYGEAINHYREAIRLNPAYATAHANLARALIKIGHRTEAEAEWNISQSIASPR